MKIRSLILSGVLCALCCCLGSTPAHAAAKGTITISPFLQNITMDGSDVDKSFTIELTNTTERTQTIQLSSVDFGSLEDTGGLLFSGAQVEKLASKYGLTQWLHFDADQLVIEPNKSSKTTVTIVNEDNLTPGGHYAAVLAQVVSADIDEQSALNLKQKLTSLLFLTKTGGEKYDLHLDSVHYVSSVFGLPSHAELRFTNPGNVQVVPRGTVELVDPSNTVLNKGIINENSNIVLPELSRKIPVDLRSITRRIRWLPGIYHIRVAYRYDGYDDYAVKTYSILYTPWLSIAAFAVCVAIILLALTRYNTVLNWQRRRR